MQVCCNGGIYIFYIMTIFLRYKSPALYEQMRSDGFVLPSSSTIARWLHGIELRPGICPDLVHFIKNKADCMSAMEKKTVLMFDEMTVKHGLEYDSKRDLVEGKIKNIFLITMIL
jgi:hypothetical protein